MADASRFPHLAPPFALAGAAAGWLSGGLVQHPLIYALDGSFRVIAALAGLTFGAATGALIRRWCVGKRYDWELDGPDPSALPPSDSWARHVFAILVAGVLAGVVVVAARDRMEQAPIAAAGGLLCALPFLPVCAAVLTAARRAQRGRHGSLVAGADRRAVWGILAITLLVASIEALPDWVAPQSGVSGPLPAVALIFASIACVTVVLVADARAYLRVRRAIAPGLVRHEADDRAVDAEAAQRLDLGVGSELHAHVQRGAAAYRSRHRATALVEGDPAQATSVLRWAVRRGLLGLTVAGVVVMAHAAANTREALQYYREMRCDFEVGESCGEAVMGGLLGGHLQVASAVALFGRSCDRGDGRSCMWIADLYRGGGGLDRDAAMVAFFEYRAAQRGLCREGQRIVYGGENRCVDADDPRQ